MCVLENEWTIECFKIYLIDTTLLGCLNKYKRLGVSHIKPDTYNDEEINYCVGYRWSIIFINMFINPVVYSQDVFRFSVALLKQGEATIEKTTLT